MQNTIELHQKLKGKISIESKVPLNSKKILSLLYTPGVASVSKKIFEEPSFVQQSTIKNNTVALVTDGSAVLGLGNIGPEAALPVMEGKSAIFSYFSGINCYPICLNTNNSHLIIETIRNISPTFGAIVLEDISAPRCFEIENALQDLNIPVVHDDQHATAIAVLSGLYNALKIVHKNISDIKIIVHGSGAAGTAITKLLHAAGAGNIIAIDRQGIISKNRPSLNKFKKELAQITNSQNIVGGLAKAVIEADVLIGVSTKSQFTPEIVNSLNKDPIIFALANPDPEINPSDAKKLGVKIIATGRSDFPNQINNALVFPGLFKGLLESRKKTLTTQSKINVAKAISSLIEHPTPAKFIPTIFDKRLVPSIVNAVKYS